MGFMLPDIGRTGARKMSLYDLFPKIPMGADSNGVVRYIDQSTATRNAAAIAESGVYPESAYAATGYTLPLEKIGDSIPITEEALRHTPRLAAEVELFMQTNVDVAIETNLATGNGTSPNLKGIYTSATAYTAPNLSITDANIFDLIVKCSEDITGNTTYGGKYMPDTVLMNITDINRMRLKKDSTNNYIVPPFVDASGKVVAGITIVECPSMAANTFALGDRRFAKIYHEDGYILSFGTVNTNFTEDVITMKARKSLALLVRTIDATGWRKCTDIDAALALLA
jgi:HK97 family phage major capsid protein